MFHEPYKNSESISRLITSLIYYSNYQTVIHTRFHNLIHKLSANKELVENDQPDRRSYLVPNDLQKELIDCKCEDFIHIKPGYLDLMINSRNFLINT